MAKQKQDALAALLGADLNVETSVPMKRLGVDLIVKAVDGKTIGRLTEQSTFGKTLDEQKFGGNIIATACTNLNFGDSKLLEKYGASDAGDCVQKALLAGEIARLSKAIMDISGFGDFDAQVDEAKN
ncbi:phage tail assembly chaperone [Peribacillus frigoritolerans]|uniref:phage tail assembly chaperone n=1 Tax=Peribacillus frigoritolerans TaxID=450367 RepID=UPI002E22A79E|nr:hypothetical protein [Peribacillus frigoritolerans]MED3845520.1 hypothetical protein [Peribacillus frigoritolerans]